MLMRALTATTVLLLAALVNGVAVSAQTPTPETPTATATVVPEKTPVPAATPQPATPLPESDKAMALVGYVIEDTDGNGFRNSGDRPAETLVTLSLTADGRVYGEGTKGASLLTDDSGRFEFDDLSPGDYELTAWWMPGFVSVQGVVVPDDLLTFPGYADEAAPRFAHMLRLKVTVTTDGVKSYSYAVRESSGSSARLRDAENAPPIPSGNLVILGRPNTAGLFPYPVTTGEGGGPLPVGKVSFGQFSMPSSGGSDHASNVTIGWWLTAIGVILLAAATAFLQMEKRRRSRRA